MENLLPKWWLATKTTMKNVWSKLKRPGNLGHKLLLLKEVWFLKFLRIIKRFLWTQKFWKKFQVTTQSGHLRVIFRNFSMCTIEIWITLLWRIFLWAGKFLEGELFVDWILRGFLTAPLVDIFRYIYVPTKYKVSLHFSFTFMTIIFRE